MTDVTRFDIAELAAHVDEDGFIHDSPVVGRIGIQEYRRADGTIRRELRRPEEVFHPDSLRSFVGKPITVDHPKMGRVTSKDAHKHSIGAIRSEGRADGDNVRTDIVIHSSDSIGERRQLSLGYRCKLDETPGIWNGQPYDAEQKEIRINHLSAVKSARAGPIARLNMDGNEVLEVILDDVSQPEGVSAMTVKCKLDNGIEYEALPEIAAELQKLRADAADAQKRVNAVGGDKDKLEAERDALKARVDGFDAELAAAKAAGRADAEARTKLDGVAASFKVDHSGMTDRQVKEAVIKAVRKDAVLDGKSDIYIDAAFDAAVDMAKEMKGDAAMASQRAKVMHNDAGANPDSGSKGAYREMMAKMTGAK